VQQGVREQRCRGHLVASAVEELSDTHDVIDFSVLGFPAFGILSSIGELV
jgi:hypothetical protein